MTTKSTLAACGIRVVASSLATRDAVAAARAALAGSILQHIIVFFSSNHDPAVLIEAMKESFPETAVSGCSTSGEIGPLGLMEGGIILIAFPESGFRLMSEVIPEIDKGGVERASEIARRLRIQMIGGATQSAKEHLFALMLVDGLSNAEETLSAALSLSLDGIELIGGSAGDGLEFRDTVLIHRGQIIRRGALFLIVETAHPVRIFKTQNFEPTSVKLVVTAADTENRIVHELNAEPAASEYAAAIGMPLEDLSPHTFASYPFVVKIGGNYYCRCIRTVNPDQSLSFYCAIDEGLVFTVARPRDMLRTTLEALEEVDAALGGTDFILGFDCILRRLDAESRQVRSKVEDLYQRFGVAGFHTYGEQFNAMHLNQTLTGIAFASSLEKPV